MRLNDCHMHMEHKMVTLDSLLRKLDEAGVEAVGAMSFPPESYDEKAAPGCPVTPDERIAQLREWMARSERIHGMFWIDPVAPDALEQADKAAEAGVCGYKVICTHFYPDDERAMRVYEHIAQIGKPVHFHSGVLYSPHASSQYNRPLHFEPLLEIPRFRFAMAHVGWPWCDEYISVFGHWRHLREQGLVTSELFIDTTPGTPRFYREDTLAKLIDFGAEDNVMFGVDNVWDYDVAYARTIADRDCAIFDKLAVPEAFREKYFYRNYLRFIGKRAE